MVEPLALRTGQATIRGGNLKLDDVIAKEKSDLKVVEKLARELRIDIRRLERIKQMATKT